MARDQRGPGPRIAALSNFCRHGHGEQDDIASELSEFSPAANFSGHCPDELVQVKPNGATRAPRIDESRPAEAAMGPHHNGNSSWQTSIMPPVIEPIHKPAFGVVGVRRRSRRHGPDRIRPQQRVSREAVDVTGPNCKSSRSRQPAAVCVHPAHVHAVRIFSALPVVANFIGTRSASALPAISMSVIPARLKTASCT